MTAYLHWSSGSNLSWQRDQRPIQHTNGRGDVCLWWSKIKKEELTPPQHTPFDGFKPLPRQSSFSPGLIIPRAKGSTKSSIKGAVGASPLDSHYSASTQLWLRSWNTPYFTVPVSSSNDRHITKQASLELETSNAKSTELPHENQVPWKDSDKGLVSGLVKSSVTTDDQAVVTLWLKSSVKSKQ